MTINRDINIVILDSCDNVATLCEDCLEGDYLLHGDLEIKILQARQLGDKIALKALRAGDKILKYGSVMGTCSADIERGEWVHIHNLKSDYLQ